ncbi:MAG: nucleoside deaminase [Chitinophagaceae bacterium]|jgi:tRNA(Arg) A34 adenosine deaminase TadA|nr:nucleoside deaminase [Chitinophagaceae bacterium]MCU0405074.1 nucleoside deaminase [Chitinophagaceae bacterium]
MITDREKHFMYLAIEESKAGMEAGDGGPFGCVIVRGDEIIGRGHNRVLCSNDPTAHAEIVAIRDACANIGNFQLSGCEVFCSCEPCPMCFGALYWARPDRIFFANTKRDAAEIGFDDAFIYGQLEIGDYKARQIPMVKMDMPEALMVFKKWIEMPNKNLY